MADIVNLRQVRKQKNRVERVRIAEQNRAAHGRSKAERDRARLLNEQTERFIHGHRRGAPNRDSDDTDLQG